jgi:monofunctional biosynthetic peptidoglycan transglycosylase
MVVVDPQSTTFQRSEAWRLLQSRARSHGDSNGSTIRAHLQPVARAVIASEDAGFAEHTPAWSGRRVERRGRRTSARGRRRLAQRAPPGKRPPKVVGGSTITQQLAKNLLPVGERTLLRKAQELLLTWSCSSCCSTSVASWRSTSTRSSGAKVSFGAQAAARHYFRVDAAQLDASAAARLAVMLPAPKRFEKPAGSAYVAAPVPGAVLARMPPSICRECSSTMAAMAQQPARGPHEGCASHRAIPCRRMDLPSLTRSQLPPPAGGGGRPGIRAGQAQGCCAPGRVNARPSRGYAQQRGSLKTKCASTFSHFLCRHPGGRICTALRKLALVWMTGWPTSGRTCLAPPGAALPPACRRCTSTCIATTPNRPSSP